MSEYSVSNEIRSEFTELGQFINKKTTFYKDDMGPFVLNFEEERNDSINIKSIDISIPFAVRIHELLGRFIKEQNDLGVDWVDMGKVSRHKNVGSLVSEWMDIDEAPKDGTHILIKNDLVGSDGKWVGKWGFSCNSICGGYGWVIVSPGESAGGLACAHYWKEIKEDSGRDIYKELSVLDRFLEGEDKANVAEERRKLSDT